MTDRERGAVPIDPDLIRRLTDIRRLLESGVIGRLATTVDPLVRADQLRSLAYVFSEAGRAADREAHRLSGPNG